MNVTHIQTEEVIFVQNQKTIHGPVQKFDFNCSYSRSRFIRLPQAISKKHYCLCHTDSYASKIIDPVINEFSPNDVSSHFHICDH